MSSRRPTQLIMGMLCRMEALARARGQMTFAILSDDCAEWAHEANECLSVIEERARALRGRVDLYAADGIFEPSERDQLLLDAGTIEGLAHSGRVS